MSRAAAHSSWQIFRWPLAIGATSVLGVLSALLGDGVYDVLSWCCLSIVVGVIVVGLARG